MSFLRGAGRTGADGGGDGRPVKALIQQGRARRSDRLCSATLACARCDAPVALGGASRTLTDQLSCPFCGHQATARDFLSLAAPTRPAHVAVRITRIGL